jgi:hypothetical protein
MEPIRTYKFYNKLSRDELIEIRDIFNSHGFFMRDNNRDILHYYLYTLRTENKTYLEIYSARILVHEELLAELFPYFLNIILIQEREVEHLLML